jgi:hypothetical protein
MHAMGAQVVKVQDHERTIYYLTHCTNAADVLSSITKCGRKFPSAMALRAEYVREFGGATGDEVRIALGTEVGVFNDLNDPSIRVRNFTRAEIATLYGVTIDQVTDRALHGIPIDKSNEMATASESGTKKWLVLSAALLVCAGGWVTYWFGIRKRPAQ